MRMSKKLVAAVSLVAMAGALVVPVPAQAHVGTTISHLWAHVRALADGRYYTKAAANARFLPGGVLPSGVTLRGTLDIGSVAPVASDLATGSISFGYTFAAAPAVTFIAPGGLSTTECPGTVAAPAALPGNLCIYLSSALNTNYGNNTPVRPFGVEIWTRALAAGDYWIAGTWAATSGATAPAALTEDGAAPQNGQ